jgi:hypothetical protein
MAETKYTSGKGTPERRIADRLKPSTCSGADHVVTKGEGPTRVVHSVYEKGQGANKGRGERDDG